MSAIILCTRAGEGQRHRVDASEVRRDGLHRPRSPATVVLMDEPLHFGGGKLAMRLTDRVEDHVCPGRHGGQHAGRQPRFQPLGHLLALETARGGLTPTATVSVHPWSTGRPPRPCCLACRWGKRPRRAYDAARAGRGTSCRPRALPWGASPRRAGGADPPFAALATHPGHHRPAGQRTWGLPRRWGAAREPPIHIKLTLSSWPCGLQ